LEIFVGTNVAQRADYKKFRTDFIALNPLTAAHKRLLPEIKLHHSPMPADDLCGSKYYMKAWKGGIWLARYILKHPEEFKGKRVLDIGTGSGLVAIAAALVGAKVTAIDNNSEAVYAAHINAEANNVKVKVIKVSLGSYKHFDDTDILTAGEVVYDPEVGKKIMGVRLRNHLTLYVSDQTGWNERDCFDAFCKNARRDGALLKILKMGTSFSSAAKSVFTGSVTAIRVSSKSLTR
jgi:predicted nicotinamide N-methyase